MEFKELGEDKVPMIGFGTWQLRGEECTKAVQTALEKGYMHIDTADVYGNHSAVKEAIRYKDREDLFITSKLWMEDYDSPKDSVQRFLIELGIDYLDLLLLHWPDSEKDMVKTIKGLEDLKRKGKIRHLGVSNFTIRHLEKLKEAGIVPEMNQVEYHPFLNQEELLRYCSDNGIQMTAYSPLGRGHVFESKKLREIAEKNSKTISQIVLRWLIQKDIIAVPKASSEQHIEENINIFDFKLSDEDMTAIDNLNENKRIINPEFSEF